MSDTCSLFPPFETPSLPACHPLIHSSCFWSLPVVGEVGPVICVGFIFRGSCACILVGGEVLSPLMGRAVWGVVFGDVYGNSVCWWLDWCFCLACYLGELSCAGCCQQLSGARSWVPMEAFAGVLTDWYSWGQEFSDSLQSWTRCSHPEAQVWLLVGEPRPTSHLYGNKGN